MERGYVKLWRKTLDSSIARDPIASHVWQWCLLKACYRPYSWRGIQLANASTSMRQSKSSNDSPSWSPNQWTPAASEGTAASRAHAVEG